MPLGTLTQNGQVLKMRVQGKAGPLGSTLSSNEVLREADVALADRGRGGDPALSTDTSSLALSRHPLGGELDLEALHAAHVCRIFDSCSPGESNRMESVH